MEPTILEPRLKFKQRLKFFKFGLWTLYTHSLSILSFQQQLNLHVSKGGPKYMENNWHF